ncbi:MAG: ammonium transporter [Pseudomonas sp.]|nr:ammonium transporter [Pseudomonas sp.]
MENNIFALQYALDTFYFLIAGAFVMWMAAGFAMLEAGLVRSKNTAEILTKNVVLYALACTLYLAVGYQIMYGGGYFLSGITALDTDAVLAQFATREDGFSGAAIYSAAADFFFQAVFVATCMSIVSGAIAERMKLWVFLVFAIVMTGLIYPVSGSWGWGGKEVFGLYSLTENLAFKDFAGSGLVHLVGASAALAGVILLGPRLGKYNERGEVRAIPGANLPLATLGTFILWFGWFGFNGGSVLKLGDINSAHSVAVVFLNTNAAAAGGLLGALIISYLKFRKADLTMILNGALAGLVAITASPDTPTPVLAVLIGLVAGGLVVFSILLMDKFKLDDPVGAISVHGVAGILGLLVVPLSATETTFLGQLIGATTLFVWAFAASFVVWWILRKLFGLRVSANDEYQGADISECGIEAYPEFTNRT